MAAKDNLNPILFHGSVSPDFKPGDEIHPTPSGGGSTLSGEDVYEPVGPKVHSTPNPSWAAMYGHVYEVEPTDPQKLENWGDREGLAGSDPEGHKTQPYHEYVSTAPMRVVRRRSDLDYPEDHHFNPHRFYRQNNKAEKAAERREGRQ